MINSRVSSKQSNIFFGSNRNSICFGCFSVCFGNRKTIFSICFGLFRCFGPVSKQPKQTEFSRNKPKQTEKIPKKRYLLEGTQNRSFFSRFEPKQTETQSVLVVFRFAFSRNPKICFSVSFDVSDRYRNNRKNRTYGIGNSKG